MKTSTPPSKSTVSKKVKLANIRLSTDDLHIWTPVIVGCTGLLVCILIAVNPGHVVPNFYTCIPWSAESQDVPLNFQIRTPQMWILVNMVLFIITFYSGFIYKIWLFWTWDKTYFAANSALVVAKPIDENAVVPSRVMNWINLWAVSFGGELSLTVINYIGLLFSFVHVSYLVTMVFARGSVILFFSWVKGKQSLRKIRSSSSEYVPLL